MTSIILFVINKNLPKLQLFHYIENFQSQLNTRNKSTFSLLLVKKTRKNNKSFVLLDR